MRRFFVAVLNDAGGVGLHPMKKWLRQNPAQVPDGLDPHADTTHQLRNGLCRHGWTVKENADEVHLIRPGGASRHYTPEPASTDEGAGESVPRLGEREWVRRLVPRLRDSLRQADSSLDVRDGYRLAYSREVLSYEGDDPKGETGMRYETDLLVVEQIRGGWTPRVVVEAKLGTVTTHDAITYSQKAATHKHVHPYLRYGVFLGGRKHYPLPGRLFRHGAHFDFMLSWAELEPTGEEMANLIRLLRDEVAASRLLQEVMFNTRARDRAAYTVFHRPVVAR